MKCGYCCKEFEKDGKKHKFHIGYTRSMLCSECLTAWHCLIGMKDKLAFLLEVSDNQKKD